MAEKWIVPSNDDDGLTTRLARELGLPKTIVGIMAARGVDGPEAAESFLNPQLRKLADPFLIPQMEQAADRLLLAIDRGENIALYGDYDVDGITSLALLCRVLKAYGGRVHPFLPLRLDEGYGLTPHGVRRCLRTASPQVLLAVDCGTGSIEEIASLRRQGVDVIVLDHHEPKGALPDCVALVNPKVSGDFRYLCAAGLAFKLSHALLKKRRLDDFDLRDYLDLVALGTVADLVPLTGENRILARRGMRLLPVSKSIGLRVLQEIASVKPPLSSADIGFRIGPRLNAAGRMGEAHEALQLLLTEDEDEARRIVATLDRRNRERQRIEQQTLREAEETLERDGNDRTALVVGGDGWHQGVVGIVAARLCRQYHRPVLVIGFSSNGEGKGSGRSIEGFSLVMALTECAPLLERFGGHEMAAGLSVRRERFEDFKKQFEEAAAKGLDADKLIPKLRLDATITLRELTHELLTAHESLQPFGNGNPQPSFLARNVVPESDLKILAEKHLRFTVSQNGTARTVIYFNAGPEQLPRPPWDLAFQIENNVFRGTSSLQVQIRSVRSAERVD